MSHAKFSPSAAERWLHCGYSIKMAPFYPSKDTAASIGGTNQHAIGAMHLENGTEPKDEKMRIYTNHVRMIATDGEMFVERKVIIEPGLCEGTLDAGVIAFDMSWGEIVDLKWGTSAVHATDNAQEKTYALGLLKEYPLPPAAPMTLTIVQPNGKTGWPVKRWETTAGVIYKFEDTIKRAIDNGLSPNPKAVPGSWCFWCPVKFHCQAYLIHSGKSKKRA